VIKKNNHYVIKRMNYTIRTCSGFWWICLHFEQIKQVAKHAPGKGIKPGSNHYALEKYLIVVCSIYMVKNGFKNVPFRSNQEFCDL